MNPSTLRLYQLKKYLTQSLRLTLFSLPRSAQIRITCQNNRKKQPVVSPMPKVQLVLTPTEQSPDYTSLIKNT